MKKRIFAAILAAAMTFSAAPTLLPAANISVSAAKSEKLPAPKNLKVSKKTDSSVTLKWSKVEGADKYAVYQYDGKTKKYGKLASVSKTSYTVTGLDAGTKYSFKVAALVKGKDGKYTAQTQSDAKSVTTDEYPTFVMPKCGAKKDAVLKSMGKNNFEGFPVGKDWAYVAKVLYDGNEADCMLTFSEDGIIKEWTLIWKGASPKDYKKFTDQFEEQYGAPTMEPPVDIDSKSWLYIDSEAREAAVVAVSYFDSSKAMMVACGYLYGSAVEELETMMAGL